MRAATIALMLARTIFVINLVLGVALWMGSLQGARSGHIYLGLLFALCLWTLAVLALMRRVVPGLALGAIVWGLVTAGIGMTQRALMVGEQHWIIQAVHVITVLGAIGMAEVMAKRIRLPNSAGSTA